MRYLIVIEKTKTGFSAYSPDVPGCVATGRTQSSVQKAMREALEFHLEGLLACGRRLPRATAPYAYVKVPVRRVAASA